MEKHEAEVSALINALFERPDVNRLSIGIEDPVEFINPHATDARIAVSKAAVREALATDETFIQAIVGRNTSLGTFFLVYYVDPGECIADYSDNEFCNETMQVVDLKMKRLA